MNVLFMTHCSKKKAYTSKKITPDKLYTVKKEDLETKLEFGLI